MILVLYLLAVICFYVFFRKKLEILFPMVIVRSKKFTKEMYTWGTKYSSFFKLFFGIGIVLGVLMMVYSFYYLVQGLIMIKQETVPRLGLLIPGMEVGGIQFPLVQGLITLSVVVLVHEFGHGLATSAEKIRPKNVALVMLLGFIFGAGVELDDKKLFKADRKTRLRIMCAGSFMNIVLAIVILIANQPLIMAGSQYINIQGLQIVQIDDGSPAQGILENGMIMHTINGIEVNTVESMDQVRPTIKPNSPVILETDKGVVEVVTDDGGWIGFHAIPSYDVEKTPVSQSIFWLSDLFGWIFIASIGLGIANMMPLWPFDGGYVISEILQTIKIDKMTKFVYYTTLFLVLVNLFSSQIRAFI